MSRLIKLRETFQNLAGLIERLGKLSETFPSFARVLIILTLVVTAGKIVEDKALVMYAAYWALAAIIGLTIWLNAILKMFKKTGNIFIKSANIILWLLSAFASTGIVVYFVNDYPEFQMEKFLIVLIFLVIGWQAILIWRRKTNKTRLSTILFYVILLIVLSGAIGLGVLASIEMYSLLGIFWVWLLLAFLTIWLLQAFTFSTRLLNKNIVISILAGAFLALVWILFFFKVDQVSSQNVRVALSQTSWTPIVFGLAFLLICIGCSSVLSILKLIFPKKRFLYRGIYAMVWLLAIIAVGYSWHGLQSVMRFDVSKKEWTQIALPPEISNGQSFSINYLRTVSNGNMYLCFRRDYDDRLAVRKGANWHSFPPNVKAKGISEDRTGKIWLWDANNVMFFKNDSLQDTPTLPPGEIQALILDKQQRPWVVLKNGEQFRIFVLDHGKWQNFTGSLEKGNSKIRGMFIDKKDSAWTTTSDGVFRSNLNALWYRLPESPNDAVNIYDSPKGLLFTREDATKGFYLLNDKVFSALEAPHGYLSIDYIYSNRYTWAVDRYSSNFQLLTKDVRWPAVDNWKIYKKNGYYYSWPTKLITDTGTGDLWVVVEDYSTITNLGLIRFLTILLLLGLIVAPGLIVAFPERYLKQAFVFKIENTLTEKPDTLFFHLRQVTSTSPNDIELWSAVVNRKSAEDKAPWRSVAKTFLQFALAKNEFQIETLEKFRSETAANDKVFIGNKELVACYTWFAQAFAAKDTRNIAALSTSTRALVELADANYTIEGKTFHPIEPFIADWLSQSIVQVCARLEEYESAVTIESKLASLAEAVGNLTPAKPSDDLAKKLLPEIQLSQNLTEIWRAHINTELDRVRGPVTLRVTPASRTVPLGEEITISIVAENIGHVVADNTRIFLDPRGDYNLGTSGGTASIINLGNLPAGAKLQADFKVHPSSQDHIRVLYKVEYFDRLRGQYGSAEYADAISLLNQEADFQVIPNPYIPGTPVEARELFFGRKDALTFAKNNLTGTKQNNVLVFHGQRRMGKTSLLKQLPQVMDREKYVFVYLDIQGYADVSTATFLFDVADEISFHLQNAGITPPEINEAAFNEGASGSFKRFIRDIAPVLNGKTLVVVFDEFETLERKVKDGHVSEEVYELLRHHMQHSPHMAFIFAGTERLFELSKDYWSTLFNIALFYEVGFLDDMSAKSLITNPTKGYLKIDEPAVEKIVELTSGHAYFIQVICRQLINHMNEVRRSIATVSDVDEVLQATIEGAQAPISYLYQEQASKDEQLVLSALAGTIKPTGEAVGLPQIQQLLEEYGFELPNDELLGRLTRLVDRKIVVQSYLRGYFFKFTVDLVRLWILRNQSIERLAKK